MTVKLFLKLTCKLREPDKWYAHQMIRPRAVCKDGWSVSIQHSESHYCSPRKSFMLDNYEAVELGYPSKSEPELEEYAEDPQNQEETVFGLVPIELVEKIVDRHGGITDVDDTSGEYFKDIRDSYDLNYAEVERSNKKMKFMEVKTPIFVRRYPRRKKHNYEILKMLEEFIDFEAKIVEVMFSEGEYVSCYTCANSIRKTIQREELP